MLNPHAKLTLGRERQKMFLADAEAARQVRQARWRRRSGAARDTVIGLLRNARADLVSTESSLTEYEVTLEVTVPDDRERVCC